MRRATITRFNGRWHTHIVSDKNESSSSSRDLKFGFDFLAKTLFLRGMLHPGMEFQIMQNNREEVNKAIEGAY